METIISPSLLSADFSSFAAAAMEIESVGAEWVQFDVMDGFFVPNITFGPKVVADLRKKSNLVFDVHLMVQNPENLVPLFIKAGADCITFHAEATVHIHKLLENIRSSGNRLGRIKAGISIVPSTPVSVLEEILPITDIVLVMTVDPGAGGQSLIPECVEKVRKLRTIRQERKLSFLISVDGGVNEDNAAILRDAGVDILVSGSVFFKAGDKAAVVRTLKGT
jgi:ribulose-phosphate 3-epimerase